MSTVTVTSAGEAATTSDPDATQLANSLERASTVLLIKCAKIDAGPVPGAAGRFGVGATPADIRRIEAQVGAAVDELVRDYGAFDDPTAALPPPSKGGTAEDLMRTALIVLRQGCGDNASKWSIQITRALDRR